ncbi:MAG TPA: metalloregulator ArsR/SmtB family transcription factor [Candidatus Limnocylindrales bacterium]
MLNQPWPTEAPGQPGDIDRLLSALADPTRRWIVERLAGGPASVTTLAAPLPMSLPAVVQHLQVLERSGLVVTEKQGRVRTCRLDPDRLRTVDDWLEDRRRTWERQLDKLADVLDEADAMRAGSKGRQATPPADTEGTP